MLQSVVDPLALKGRTLIGVKVIDPPYREGEHSDGALRVCEGYCNRG